MFVVAVAGGRADAQVRDTDAPPLGHY